LADLAAKQKEAPICPAAKIKIFRQTQQQSRNLSTERKSNGKKR
jgi:hypothetical protein